MKNRRGVALAGAIMALVCSAALLVAVAFTGREEQLLAGVERDAWRAFTGAERAAWTALASLASADTALELGLGRAVPIAAAPADTISATVTRLAPALFVAVGEAGVGGQGGRLLWKRVGIFARFVRDSAGGGSFEPLPERAWAELP